MGSKLPPKELELYKRCDEVLHYVWDPIGVAGIPEARDEYEGYLPQVWRLVMEEADPDKIVDYLINLEKEHMEIHVSGDRAREAVDTMRAWRDRIWRDEE